MEDALVEAKALADSEGSRAVKYLRVIRKVRAVVDEWPEVDLADSPLSRIRTIVAFAGTQTAATPAGPTAAPMCRDCADFGPICPNSGKPCAALAQPAPVQAENESPGFTTKYPLLNDLLQETWWLGKGPNNHDTRMAWFASLEAYLASLAAPVQQDAPAPLQFVDQASWTVRTYWAVRTAYTDHKNGWDGWEPCGTEYRELCKNSAGFEWMELRPVHPTPSQAAVKEGA
jgi:hypothetical protein